MVPEILSMTEIIFCHFGPFLALLPCKNLKNQNFKIMKKPPGDTITLHICTINGNHMMYGSWDIEHDRPNFLLFCTMFCPFTPQKTKKIKILKKWKKHLEILSFYTSVLKMTIIWSIAPEIWSVMDRIFCHFGLLFALLPLTHFPPP